MQPAMDFQWEKGYISQPMAIASAKNQKKHHKAYLIRRWSRRRPKVPKAMEMSSAKSTIA
jgi:hypothetical protein